MSQNGHTACYGFSTAAARMDAINYATGLGYSGATIYGRKRIRRDFDVNL